MFGSSIVDGFSEIAYQSWVQQVNNLFKTISRVANFKSDDWLDVLSSCGPLQEMFYSIRIDVIWAWHTHQGCLPEFLSRVWLTIQPNDSLATTSPSGVDSNLVRRARANVVIALSNCMKVHNPQQVSSWLWVSTCSYTNVGAPYGSHKQAILRR